MSEPQSAHLMDAALRASHLFWILELKDKPVKYLYKRKEICAQVVAEKGDVLMYGSKIVGDAADVFNRLAEGIAILCILVPHSVPFGKTLFFKDGSTKGYESEKEASGVVWPKENV